MRLLRATLALVAVMLIAAPTKVNAEMKLLVAMPTTPPNVVHMPVLVAKELGLFKKRGLTVETVALAGGVKTFRAMVAGSVDVAMATGPFSIIGRAKGAPTKIILTNLPKIEASMVVRANIKTIADLKGKRIGIQQPGGFADVLSRAVLRAAKVNPRDVHFVSIATEDVPALVANQVDTAILHIEQETIAKSKVPDLHAIARLWKVLPKNLGTVMVVTEKSIKDKHAALEAFVKGNIEATRLLYTDRSKAIPAIMKYTGLSKDIATKTYEFMVENCIWDANDGLSPTQVNFTASLMTKVGNIPKGKTPKYGDIVDLSLAHEAIKELGAWKGPVCPSKPN
jgi:NitT/TauT family transport system substrate-binding protein